MCNLVNKQGSKNGSNNCKKSSSNIQSNPKTGEDYTPRSITNGRDGIKIDLDDGYKI